MSDNNTTEKKVVLDLKEMGKDFTGKARDIWLAGLGALSSVEEQGNKIFKNLVEKGTELEKKGKEQIESVYGKAKEEFNKVEGKVSKSIEDTVSDVLDKIGVPSRDEVNTLISKVDALAGKVDELAGKLDSSAAKTAAKRTPATKA